MTAIVLDLWHATPGGYTNHKCRCDGCRWAWAAYQRAAYQRRRKRRSRVREHPSEMRAEAVRLRMQEGMTNRQISTKLHISMKTIYSWMGATPRRLGGGPFYKPTLHARAIYLKQAGYSHRAISKEMNVPRSTIGDWVSGV
jgi:IS30 family transposase